MGTLSVSPCGSNHPVVIAPLMHLTTLRLCAGIHLLNGPEGCGRPVITRALCFYVCVCVYLCIHLSAIFPTRTTLNRLICLTYTCHQGRFELACVYVQPDHARACVAVNSPTASAISPLWTVTKSSAGFALIHCWRMMMDGCLFMVKMLQTSRGAACRTGRGHLRRALLGHGDLSSRRWEAASVSPL